MASSRPFRGLRSLPSSPFGAFVRRLPVNGAYMPSSSKRKMPGYSSMLDRVPLHYRVFDIALYNILGLVLCLVSSKLLCGMVTKPPAKSFSSGGESAAVIAAARQRQQQHDSNIFGKKKAPRKIYPFRHACLHMSLMLLRFGRCMIAEIAIECLGLLLFIAIALVFGQVIVCLGCSSGNLLGWRAGVLGGR